MSDRKPAIVYFVPRLVALAASVVVALLIAEAFARAIYRPPIDVEGDFEGRETYADQLDADGFRESAMTEDALGEDTTRVLFLGDSFTFGSGVPDPSLRFTDRLESRFNRERAESGRRDRVHFFNAGIPGSRPTQWVDVTKFLLPRDHPHAIVAVFFLRDGTELGTSLYFYKQRIADIRAAHCGNLVYRFSHLARLVCDRRVDREFSDWYLGQFRTAYLGTPQQQKVWHREQKKLLELQDLATEGGAAFHLVIFPLLFGLEDYGFHDVETEIRRFATENGMPVMSLISGFEGHDARELWVSSVDQHPNERGHEIAAEALSSYLREMLAGLDRG